MEILFNKQEKRAAEFETEVLILILNGNTFQQTRY